MSDAWEAFVRELYRERFEHLTREQLDARIELLRTYRDDDETTELRRQALERNE